MDVLRAEIARKRKILEEKKLVVSVYQTTNRWNVKYFFAF